MASQTKDRGITIGVDIMIFVDCQSAIVSAFGIGIPKYKVGIIFNIRRLTSLLENDNNNLKIHWIPGH